MASHRKPRTRVLQSPAARRGAVSVTSAALASVTLLSQSAHAEPEDKPSIEEVKKRVDELYHHAESATQRYNAAKESTDEQRRQVEKMLDEVAERTEKLNEARRMLGQYAAAQYRTGGMSETATLLLSADPQGFFSQTHIMDRLTAHQQQAVDDFQQEQKAAAEQRAEATQSLATLTASQTELSTAKKTVQTKLAEARELLSELTAEEQARLAELERRREAEARRKAAELAEAERRAAEEERQRQEAEAAEQQAAEEAARQEAAEQEAAEQQAAEEQAAQQEQQTSSSGSASTAEDTYAAKAAKAVAFAREQLGKPYVWGATGPNSWDCSSLTQAAWRAAGVEIPRVTWDQVNIGTRVAKAEMQPGDLIFFYNDISHVGLYIGDGVMIHAPKPGDVVKVESIDYMPFHSAVRPA